MVGKELMLLHTLSSSRTISLLERVYSDLVGSGFIHVVETAKAKKDSKRVHWDPRNDSNQRLFRKGHSSLKQRSLQKDLMGGGS